MYGQNRPENLFPHGDALGVFGKDDGRLDKVAFRVIACKKTYRQLNGAWGVSYAKEVP